MASMRKERATNSVGYHKKAELTEAQRQRMQMTYKNTEVSLKVLARRFGVSVETATALINNGDAAHGKD